MKFEAPMSGMLNSDRAHKYSTASWLFALTTVAIGALVLVGWAFDIPALKSVLPGFVTMKVNTALGLTFLGAALMARTRAEKRGEMTLASRFFIHAGPPVALLLGILTLIEYFFSIDLRIDEAFVRDLSAQQLNLSPGRMAGVTALSFMLLGFSMLISESSKRRSALWQVLVLSVLFLNSVAFFGYLFGATSFVAVYLYSAVALQTCVAFLLLGVGLLFSRPKEGIMIAFTSSSSGGQLSRRLLPAAILLLAVTALLIRQAARRRLFEVGFALDLNLTIGSFIIGWLVWWNARIINESDARSQALYRKLESSERQLHLAMDSVPVLISYVDAQLRYRFVNASYSKWFNRSVENIIGKHVSDLLGPEAYDHIRPSIESVLTGRTVTFEAEVPYHEAGKRYVLASYVPDLSSEGEVRGFFSVVSDLTERKRAEERLRQAERALKKINEELEDRVRERTREVELQGRIVQNIAEGVCLVSAADRTITYANPKFEAMFGYAPGELLGKPVEILNYGMSPGQARAVAETMITQIREYGVHTYEIQNVKKDGTSFWCRATGSIFDDAKFGKIFVVVQEDITERRAAELELRKSEDRFHQLIEHSTDGIFIADAEGRYIEVNPAACQMLGYSREQLLGRNITDIIRPEELPRLLADRARVLHRGEVVFSEWQLKRKDGIFVDAEVATKLLPDGRWTAFVRDISERKQFEASLERRAKELARSNAELEQFAYVASHDLREPLRMVTNYIQLLERKYKDQLGEPAEKYLRYIIEGVDRMQTLISDLLTYSRVSRPDLIPEVTDMNQILENTLKVLAAPIQEAAAHISSDPLPVLYGNPIQMQQLLQNLLSNAIKFNRKDVPPDVHISAEERADHWVISVSDNGIGIEPQYADRIFVLFQRLHSRSEYPGTGIGLAICKKIVDRLGGTIWMKSQPGAGSTFYFTIPKRAAGVLPQASGI